MAIAFNDTVLGVGAPSTAPSAEATDSTDVADVTVEAPTETSAVGTLLADATPASSGLCPSCAHPLADHDAISARYCLASGVSGSTRGCICAGSAH